mmetsp:Transcript_47969/g.74926  ORF Transcript_47969/g.74926 Transcript_47969/m.74926 type:complete len:219 (-) Transcript_47969:101-757(-)
MQQPQQYAGVPATLQAMPQQDYGYSATQYQGMGQQSVVGYSDSVPLQSYGMQYPASPQQPQQYAVSNGTNGYAQPQAVQPPPVQPFPAKQPYQQPAPQFQPPQPQYKPQPQYQAQAPAPQAPQQAPAPRPSGRGRLIKQGRYWPSKFFPLITKSKPVYESDLQGYTGQPAAAPAPAPVPVRAQAPPVQQMPQQNYGQAPAPPPIAGGYFEEGSSGEAL